ncbi:uncharacterized protein EV420DRAFT_1133659 [Desarmillaria tabescens]|uniref:Uncharacterized protein n=1 Tax=Armillaria tabescens TaxID=1929756 RepID=A0AA39JCT7_ARMTA|nr:uncharacterized protein EV420DRAFT_1133659 [Desarmillaria tabescens]KAK0440410.1 hypothetical protein EV420DRAFT_1133659 [Desarmillaria tabescens]
MALRQESKLEYVLTLASTAFSTSTSLYTLACTFVLYSLLIYPILPPLTTWERLQHLEGTIHEITTLFNENNRVLADPVTVDIQINDIQLHACSLIRRLLYANASVSINCWSWFRYLSEMKAIWTDVRQCQIEADGLKRKVKIAMIEEKEGRLRDEVTRKRRSSTGRGVMASF